jgi:gamma-glutamyl hercynylcysteine S-oxide synthase
MATATTPMPELRSAITNARGMTDELFGSLEPPALYERPIAERHRLIFYLGHLESFDWNQIARAGLGLDSRNPDFDKLFEFGIDPAVGSIQQDQPADWPTISEVRDYNHRTRAALDSVIEHAPADLLHIALEHRLMHAETLAYMLHGIPYNLKHGPAPSAEIRRARVDNPMITIPTGHATLGLRAGTAFGWDNEFDEHSLEVPAFRVSRYKITNVEYLAHVEAGAEPPQFWIRCGGDWNLRCQYGEIPLPLDWPVYVTHEQATRYAYSRGCSLPSERQFHRAAFGTVDGSQRSYPWGDAPPERMHGNFDFRSWDPVAVDATPSTDSAFGVRQLVGNGWEWTSTVFAPFEGFRPFPTYAGYSANFFDGDHYVLKGGSARTAAPLLRRSFRNWFRPDYSHVYAGFRIVENL